MRRIGTTGAGSTITFLIADPMRLGFTTRVTLESPCFALERSTLNGFSAMAGPAVDKLKPSTSANCSRDSKRKEQDIFMGNMGAREPHLRGNVLFYAELVPCAWLESNSLIMNGLREDPIVVTSAYELDRLAECGLWRKGGGDLPVGEDERFAPGMFGLASENAQFSTAISSCLTNDRAISGLVFPAPFSAGMLSVFAISGSSAQAALTPVQVSEVLDSGTSITWTTGSGGMDSGDGAGRHP